MGMRIPETCWTVSKRQLINSRSCCILLVDSVKCLMMHGLAKPKKYTLHYTPTWCSVISLIWDVCYACNPHNCMLISWIPNWLYHLTRHVFLAPSHAKSQSHELSLKYFYFTFYCSHLNQYLNNIYHMSNKSDRPENSLFTIQTQSLGFDCDLVLQLLVLFSRILFL
jgi:hypothetical protein